MYTIRSAEGRDAGAAGHHRHIPERPERGKFDPEIVDLLPANLDQINELIKDLSA